MTQRIRRVARRWEPERRAKVRLSLWLRPSTLAALRTRAGTQRVPIAELAERFIREGLEDGAAHQLEESALPALTAAVRVALAEERRQTEERLARLLTRAIIASDTTRRLLFAHMARQWGGAEQIRPVHDSARTAAIDALRERGSPAALRLDVEELAE
jgi:hypothetical protein